MPGIYALAPGGWNDQQITKNCGLLPWLFHKKYGWEAVMVGVRTAETYPSLRYVPGLRMDFLADDRVATADAYLDAHAADIDVLCLHGFMPGYFPVVEHYRAVRPEGKIYLELDPNIYYESRLDWSTPEARAFLASCDVIGASCHRMQCYLGQTWPVIIDYLPNGFYDYTGAFRPMTDADFAAKEDVILTVGRLGTPQKQTETLVRGFVAAAERGGLDGWRLELVGSVTEPFRAWLEEVFMRHPAMRQCIEIAGPVFDKAELYQRYRRAKVFALTSLYEGGTPNVVAEALVHGCAMVTSDIDAWEDIIDSGRCGMHFPVGDVEAFAEVLAEICGDSGQLASFGRHAAAYAAQAYDFTKIADQLYVLLCGRRPGV
ncbi:glycosyltransferase family 4 protein [uncultured Selenomonas sp.]|uniref:glycosyltransferase family 4 protein n=1 Tax=uncultured Selenomonas sp. TaxID=159275 RepID=UPI0025CFC802|nr:glycosyltransferase family 4 protein [uncultured Selenomonas sp.]